MHSLPSARLSEDVNCPARLIDDAYSPLSKRSRTTTYFCRRTTFVNSSDISSKDAPSLPALDAAASVASSNGPMYCVSAVVRARYGAKYAARWRLSEKHNNRRPSAGLAFNVVSEGSLRITASAMTAVAASSPVLKSRRTDGKG